MSVSHHLALNVRLTAHHPMRLPTYLLAAYFVCTVLIAVWSHHRQRTSNDFLNETGNLPTWVATISFLAANCGALEIVGLSGIAARYGVQAFHFYWIGAIPALVFVSFVALPTYHRSGVKSVPEFLGRRFGREVRLCNAAVLLGGTCLTAGVSLYAVAEILHLFAGWRLLTCILVAAAVAITNILTGGLRGTMRTEILHFCLMIVGLSPMLYLSFRFGGHHLDGNTTWAHLWQKTPVISSHLPVDMFGVVLGLGLVIGFSYWCTDFVLMQRALTARSPVSARKVPLYAGFGKLLFSFLVVMPVILTARGPLLTGNGNLDQTAGLLIRSLYGSRFWAAGMLALVASLMTGLSANVAAFASLWTQEIYKGVLQPYKTEQHYIFSGRLASIICILLSFIGAYATLQFESLSEFMLAIFSLTMIPFFAVVLYGIFSPRRSTTGVISGAASGIVMGALMTVACHLHLLHFGSELNANFYTAIVSFATSALICVAASHLDSNAYSPDGRITAQSIIDTRTIPIPNTLYLLAGLLLVSCVVLNVLWR